MPLIADSLTATERQAIAWMNRNPVHGFSVQQARKRRRLSTSRVSAQFNQDPVSIVLSASTFARLDRRLRLVRWSHDSSERTRSKRNTEILWLTAKGRRLAEEA